jgi:hypothetical protein
MVTLTNTLVGLLQNRIWITFHARKIRKMGWAQPPEYSS